MGGAPRSARRRGHPYGGSACGGDVQGRQDEYATLEQIEAIGRRAPRAERLILEPCGHFPHLTHADAVIDGIAAFIGDRN
jgi:pimeloyl-ACP methyl ester carboxylesterase